MDAEKIDTKKGKQENLSNKMITTPNFQQVEGLQAISHNASREIKTIEDIIDCFTDYNQAVLLFNKEGKRVGSITFKGRYNYPKINHPKENIYSIEVNFERPPSHEDCYVIAFKLNPYNIFCLCCGEWHRFVGSKVECPEQKRRQEELMGMVDPYDEEIQGIDNLDIDPEIKQSVKNVVLGKKIFKP